MYALLRIAVPYFWIRTWVFGIGTTMIYFVIIETIEIYDWTNSFPYRNRASFNPKYGSIHKAMTYFDS